jgi:hypothetical protein
MHVLKIEDETGRDGPLVIEKKDSMAKAMCGKAARNLDLQVPKCHPNALFHSQHRISLLN